MVAQVLGATHWEAERDNDGHRDYRIRWRIACSDPNDGPQTVSFASGLPAVGTPWQFGNDSDAWAFCWPDWKMTPQVDEEQNVLWYLDQHFSTRPLNRCQQSPPDNPMLEPIHTSGTFTQYTEEASLDKDKKPIVNSAWEPIKGKAAERDFSRPTVSITQNLATLPLANFASMIHTVNDAKLWGLPARTIKFSNATWARKLYGVCTYYYTVTYDFDIRFDTFDRVVDDEGTKVLAPGGDPTNPTHFILSQDIKDNVVRILLDGSGKAWQGPNSTPATPGKITIKFYGSSNFLLLGVPLFL